MSCIYCFETVKNFLEITDHLINGFNAGTGMIKQIREVEIDSIKYMVVETNYDSYRDVETVIKDFGHHFQYKPLIITSLLKNTLTNEYFNTFVLSKEYGFEHAIKLAENDYCSAIFKNKPKNIH